MVYILKKGQNLVNDKFWKNDAFVRKKELSCISAEKSHSKSILLKSERKLTTAGHFLSRYNASLDDTTLSEMTLVDWPLSYPVSSWTSLASGSAAGCGRFSTSLVSTFSTSASTAAFSDEAMTSPFWRGTIYFIDSEILQIGFDLMMAPRTSLERLPSRATALPCAS